ncbi:hypothetical protein [Leptospira bouyouniensis]|uniref:Uncharacterized protein n=1 Tax=Leptospira bouyouniensis TaxID=2484911 RepID=A0ABY2L9K3_9LEPT|nr:hypothetical protein [Leptospira bouyouniensis]TGK54175.1 hypothetical protein EHQ10_00415 [Leptospira bouyouniensis]
MRDQRPQFIKDLMGNYYDPRMDPDYNRSNKDLDSKTHQTRESNTPIYSKLYQMQSVLKDKLSSAKTLDEVNRAIDLFVGQLNKLPLKERLQMISAVNSMNMDLPLKSYYGSENAKVIIPVFEKPATSQLNDSYAAQVLRENLPNRLKESIELVPKPDPQKIIKQLREVDSAYANAYKTLGEKQAEFDQLRIELAGRTNSDLTKPLFDSQILDSSTNKDLARLAGLEKEMNHLKEQMTRTEAAAVRKYEEIYRSKERQAVALGIAKDPMLKSMFSSDLRSKALELDAVIKEQRALKEKLLHQDPALVSQADKDALAKLTEKMRILEKAFDEKYGSSLDSLIKIPGSGVEVVTDDFQKILADPKQLIVTTPAVYINRELPLTINPSTGQFVIGTPRDAEYFKNMAGSEAYQSKDSTKAFELAFGFVNDTNSPSDPGFIRDRWCVAFSNWSLLKANLGDAVPDFDQFIKDCAKNNLINKSDMTVNTEAVVNYYSHGLGKFERDKFENLPDPANRDNYYEKLGEVLKQEKPNVITLRVHERHTISLHKNPPDVNGKITYTVVDTGNATMNGTKFDPENPLSSTLGDTDSSTNTYRNLIPKSFDIIR